jgi:hypothetical protein
MDIAVAGDSLSGTANWTWTDGLEHGQGTSKIQGQRVSGGGGGNQGGGNPTSLSGDWAVSEVIQSSSLAALVGRKYEYKWKIEDQGDTLLVKPEGASFTAMAVRNSSGNYNCAFEYRNSAGELIAEKFDIGFDRQANPPVLAGSSRWSISGSAGSATGESVYAGVLRNVGGLHYGGPEGNPEPFAGEEKSVEAEGELANTAR